MKILMLLQSEFPPDIRIEREIKTLYEAGHKVNIICNQYSKTACPDFPSCETTRIKAIFDNVRLNKILNFPVFINPRFIFTTIKTYLKFKPNVVHAHDLPMVPLALLLKFMFNVPVVFDSHENYPAALIFFKKKGLLNFIFKNPKAARLLEDYSIKKVDKIITVVEEFKNNLIHRGVDADKISVVSNTICTETFLGNTSNDFVLPEIFKNNFVFVYTGKVSPDRGLEVPIKALKSIMEKIPNAIFAIVGEGPNLEELKELAKREKVEEFVYFMKWPGHRNIPEIIKASKVGVIPQPSNEFIDSTIPNKLFEYMFMEKPVLISDAKAMKRIVEETKCGVTFRSGDSEDFADKLFYLSEHKNNYALNGKKAVIDKYNWKKDAQKLLELYSKIEKGKSGKID